jgi:ribonuclease D
VYVRDDAALRALAESMRGADAIAIDTEFMREKTYYARLCLIQVATDDIVAAIDPFAVKDLGPLFELMRDERCVKVFHAGSQDLEIFYRLMGEVPAPVFDTQVAATLTGLPTQVGYQQLIRSLVGVELDKAHSFTDWARRPLSEDQVEYALDDVRYLTRAYRTLCEVLDRGGRLGWLAEDFARMADPATYDVVPGEQFLRVKRASVLDRRSLAVLREVAAWREREAQERDIPRRWLVSDESLIEIARRAPGDRTALLAVRGLNEQVVRRSGEDILEAVKRGRSLPEDDLPKTEKRKRLHGEVEELADLMSALVRLRAKEHDVAPTLLATRDDLERFAGGERDGSPLASGWRHTLVGSELEALLNGEIALSVGKGRVTVAATVSDPVEQSPRERGE